MEALVMQHQYVAADSLLKIRLMRAALCVPLFSEKQKLMILSTSVTCTVAQSNPEQKLECPKDLERFVYVPQEATADQIANLQIEEPPSLYHSQPTVLFRGPSRSGNASQQLTPMQTPTITRKATIGPQHSHSFQPEVRVPLHKAV